MKKQKNILKIAAVTVLSVSMSGLLLPVHAEGNDTVTKDEDVFVVLNSDGSVSDVTVSDKLHSDSGFNNYSDTSSLTDVENIKNNDPVVKSGDGYTWNTTEQDVYYQGKYVGELPLEVTVKYQLDGKDIKAEDLVGKAGHVKMTITYDNKISKVYSVNGKSYTIALPIATVAGAIMKSSDFSNVTTSLGNVTTDSSNSIVTAVSLPGLKKSLSGIVSAKFLSKIDQYLLDQFTIEADTTSFVSPQMMLAASTDLEELKTELGGTDLSAAWADLDKLQSSTQQLIEGAQTLYDGASEVSEGGKKLSDNASLILDATNQIAEGTSQLSEGVAQVANGASSLNGVLGQLSGNSATLNAGANQIKDTIFATVSTQINESDTVKASGKTYTLTSENYADVLAGLLNITDGERTIAFNQVKATVEESVPGVSDDIVNALIYLASIHSTGDFTTDMNTQAASLQSAQIVSGYGKNYTSMAAALTDEKVVTELKTVAANQQMTDTIKAQLIAGIVAQAKAANPALASYTDEQILAAVAQSKGCTVDQLLAATFEQYKNSLTNEQLYAMVAGQLKAQNADLTDENVAMIIAYTADNIGSFTAENFGKTSAAIINAQIVSNEMAKASEPEGQQVIKSALDTLVLNSDMYKEAKTQLTEAKSQLDQLMTFVNGLQTYTGGVDQLYTASNTLVDGAGKVSSSSSTLANACSQFAGKIAEFKTGTETLSGYIDKITEGSKTLLDGINQYNEEGISKIADSSEVSDIKNADALLGQIKKSADEYDNYSGISKGTEGSVKFIYKINSPKTTTTTTSKDTADVDVTKATDQGNFFEKIANLFVFWK